MKAKIRNGIKIFILFIAAALFSAAGIPSMASSSAPSAIRGVAVSPASADVAKGSTCTYTASVTGENDYSSEVVWSVSGQTSQSTFIDTKGVLNVAADEGAENLVVKAVSRQDSAYSATALAVVKSASYQVKVSVNDENGGTVTEGKTVNAGENVTIKATPKDGWRFVEWKENDKGIGTDPEITLENITGDRNLTAVFEQETPKTYTVAAAVATAGGIITPTGASPVPAGSWIGYAITPDSGFRVRMVYVDGTAVGAATSYQFTDVNENHTISAEFEPDSAQTGQNQTTQTADGTDGKTSGNSTANHDDPEKADTTTSGQKPSEKADGQSAKEQEKAEQAEREAAEKAEKAAEREQMEQARMEQAQADAEAERAARIEQEKEAIAQEKAAQAAAEEEAAQKRTRRIIIGVVAAIVALCAAGVFVVVRR